MLPRNHEIRIVIYLWPAKFIVKIFEFLWNFLYKLFFCDCFRVSKNNLVLFLLTKVHHNDVSVFSLLSNFLA
jgi:hypothetical protein